MFSTVHFIYISAVQPEISHARPTCIRGLPPISRKKVPESCGQKACVKSPVTSVEMRERERGRERTK